MEKLPYQEIDTGVGQLMDRPEIAYVLGAEFQIECWGHRRWPPLRLLNDRVLNPVNRET
jgi:hypothetical protein